MEIRGRMAKTKGEDEGPEKILFYSGIIEDCIELKKVISATYINNFMGTTIAVFRVEENLSDKIFLVNNFIQYF